MADAKFRQAAKRLKKALGTKYENTQPAPTAGAVGSGKMYIGGQLFDGTVSGVTQVVNVGRPAAASYAPKVGGTTVIRSGGSSGTTTGGSSGPDVTTLPLVTVAADSNLYNERYLAVSAALSLTDGGAGSALTIGMATPPTLSVSSTNDAATGSHAITSSSSPGAAASLLASDASGFLTLPKFVATTKVTTPSIDNTGDILIDPSSRLLHVDGVVKASYTAVATAGAILQNIQDVDASYTRAAWGYNATWNTTSNLWSIGNAGANDAAMFLVRNSSAAIDLIMHASAGSTDRTMTHAEFTAGKKFIFTSAGQLGINSTSDPSYNLDVTGTARITTSLTTPLLTTATDVDLVINPAGTGAVQFPDDQKLRTTTFDSSFPIAGWQINEHADISGKSVLTIGEIQADELSVRIFVADEVRVDRGDEYWTKSYGILAEPFTTPGSIGGTVSITVEDSPAITGAVFSNNDWVLIRKLEIDTGLTLYSVWGQVATYVNNSDGTQSWTFTLRSGPTSEDITKGSLVIDFGATGAALIHLSVIDSAGAPYIKMRKWVTNPYTPANYTTYIQLGELGSTGNAYVTPSGYGLYVRSTSDAARFLLADDNGLQIRGAAFKMYNSTLQTVDISATDGSLKLGTDISSGSTTGLAFDGATGNVTIGGASYSPTVTIYGVVNIKAGSSGIAQLTDAGALATADDLDDVPNGSTYYRTTANQVTGATRAYTAINSSNNLVTSVIPATAAAPSGAGLYLASDYMGYYSGSAWKTYMDSSGNFKFAGNSASNYIQWTASSNKLQGVGGSIEQWYADATDGKLYAGAGAVWLDSAGVNISVEPADVSPSYVRFMDSTTEIGSLGYFYTAGPTPGATDGMNFNVDTGHKFRFVGAILTEFDHDVDIDGDITGSGALTVTGTATARNIYLDADTGATSAITRWITSTSSNTFWQFIAQAHDYATSAQQNDLILQWYNGSAYTTLLYFDYSTLDIGTRAIKPLTTDTYDIGTSSLYYNNAYIRTLYTDTIVGTPSYSHTHAAGDITSGTLDDARLPTTQTGKTFTGSVVIDADSSGTSNYVRWLTQSSSGKAWDLTGRAHDYATSAQQNDLLLTYYDGSSIYTVFHADSATRVVDFGQTPTVSGTAVSLVGHTHDDRYYTESETTTLLAGYVPTSRTVSAGSGLTGGGALSSNITISHGDTSSQASVDNSGTTFIQDITLDTYGHVTAIGSADIGTALDSRYVNVSGDTMTSTLAIDLGAGGRLRFTASSGYGYVQAGDPSPDDTGGKLRLSGWNASDLDSLEVKTGGGWYDIWHAGNDGAGSGLDADLWDGNQFATYLNQPVLTSSSVTFGTAAITGALTGSNATFTDYVSSAADTDNASTFGRVRLGYATGSDTATFSHYDRNTSTGYALSQNASGATTINAASGQVINLAINNGAVASIAGTAWTTAGWTKSLRFPGNGYAMVWDTTTARGIGASTDGVLYVARSTATDSSADITYDMTVDTSGNVTVAQGYLGGSNYTSQISGWRVTQEGGADFRYLYADQMHVKAFVADLEQALAGGQIIAKSVAVLAEDFVTPYAGGQQILTVEDLPSAPNMATFESGDYVRLRVFNRSSGSLNISDCWGTVSNYADGTGVQTWTFTRSGSTTYDTIALRGTATSSSSSAETSRAPAKPTGVASGDTMIAVVTHDGAATTVTPPAGWTELTYQSGTDINLGIYYKVAGSSEGSSYTFTISESRALAVGIIAYDNCNVTFLPYDEFDYQVNSASTSMTAPGVWSTSTAGMLLFVGGVTNNSASTPPASMTERLDTGSTGIRVYMADQLLAVGGDTGSKTATISASHANIAACIMLKPSYSTFTTDTAGAVVPGVTISADDNLVLDYGTSGNGYHEVNAVDGAYGVNSPYSQVVTWTSHPATGQIVRTRMGNLYGITAVSGEYGLYAGDGGITAGNQYLRVSTDGVQLNNVPIKLYNSGTQTVNLDSAGTDIWIGPSSGDKRLSWNGTTLSVVGAITVASGSSGIASFSDANLDNISDGTTYGRLDKTIIAGGLIQVGSGTKDSTLSGWHISGSEIVGQASGVDQVVMATTGKLTAGAGAVALDVNGITLTAGTGEANKITWYNGATKYFEQYGYSTGSTYRTVLNAASPSGSTPSELYLYAQTSGASDNTHVIIKPGFVQIMEATLDISTSGKDLSLNGGDILLGGGTIDLQGGYIAGVLSITADVSTIAINGDLDMNGNDILDVGTIGDTATWTPDITFGGGSTGITYASRSGRYVKIGKLVFISVYISLSNKGSSTGLAKIGNLPFTHAATIGSVGSVIWYQMSTNFVYMTGVVDASATTATLVGHTAASASYTGVTHADFANNSIIQFTAMYEGA